MPNRLVYWAAAGWALDESALQILFVDVRSVMIPARKDANLVLVNLIDKSMLVINPLRPATGKLMLEWFRLADAAERIGQGFLNEANNTPRFLSVLLNPPR